ncbi:MAG: transcriptional repressor LexA, partial [Betaproteobacteria bacterium]|nr:transcriptional repressor LexA [Betaproteobacteria bacterium]
EHLRALERNGAIEMLAGSSRGIKIRDGGALGTEAANDEEVGMPLIGRVAAGSPILAQENVLGRYPVSPLMFKPRADYLLQVSGMSMKDAGIMDGDWLAVHKTSQARNGQIVVARVEGDATVKRLKLKGRQAFLIAENPDFLPIVVDLDKRELDIEGLVVGVVRTM